MLIQPQVASAVPGTRASGTPTALALQLGEFGVSDVLPRLAALGWSGKIFSTANQAAQAVSVALATTYTGLGIYNPVGSGVNLIPLKVKFALSVAPAAIATIGAIAAYAATGGVTAQTTKTTVQSGIIGNTGTGQGIGLSAATIVTPTWFDQFRDGFTASSLPNPTSFDFIDGYTLVAPGGFYGIGALTAVTGLGAIFWAELPV
jgi:hypothetical protein